MQERKKVIVVGAGIAGLSAAVYAAKCGFDVTVMESHSIALQAACVHLGGVPAICLKAECIGLQALARTRRFTKRGGISAR